ncbi:MAG TPA: acetyltransferase [Nitrospiria bacterium]|nr:acetyltransferase [Nitrospiria bacterium]
MNAMRVVIVGAGGHGHVVADIFLARSRSEAVRVVGFLDDDSSLHGTQIMGIPVIGSFERLGDVEHDGVIVAIGTNRTRGRVFDACKARGERLVNAIHPAAVVGTGARFGEGVMVCAGVVVNPLAVIGDDVILNTSCTVDHHVGIEAHAHVGPGVHLAGEVRVGEGALVGVGANVIPRCAIGAWSVIGAGSAVITDVPAETTAVGVPARVISGVYQVEQRP